jgi:hypothetical protein
MVTNWIPRDLGWELFIPMFGRHAHKNIPGNELFPTIFFYTIYCIVFIPNKKDVFYLFPTVNILCVLKDHFYPPK